MANQDLQDNISSSSTTSTNNHLQMLAQNTQRIVRIPHRVILDIALSNLGLEPAQYICSVHTDGKIRITALFNTAALDLPGSIIDVSVPGDYCTDDESAEDTTSTRAVRYIETITNTSVRDLNHAKTQRQQARIDYLQRQLKKTKLKNKRLQKECARSLSRAKDLSTELNRYTRNEINPEPALQHAKPIVFSSMPTRRHYSYDSPDSDEFTGDQRSQAVPRLIKIPCKTLLDIMITQLGMPGANYSCETYEDGTVCFLVEINESESQPTSSDSYISVHGQRCMDVSVAEDTAIVKAIRCLEVATNTVVVDLNHDRVERMKLYNAILNVHLQEKLKENSKLVKGWLMTARHMASFSMQIRNVIVPTLAYGCDAMSKAFDGVLLNIQEIADRMKYTGNQFEPCL